MAENSTTEGSPYSKKAMEAIGEQAEPSSLLGRIFGRKSGKQPAATATSPVPEPAVVAPKAVESPWVQEAEGKTLPAKDYTVAPDTRVPKKVWGED